MSRRRDRPRTHRRNTQADARPTADGLFLRGEAYRALGRREGAVRTLERYLELSPVGQYAAPAERSLGLLLADVDGSG